MIWATHPRFAAAFCLFLFGTAHATSIFTQTAPCAPSQSVCDIGIAPDNSTPAVTTSDMVINDPGASILNDGQNNLWIILLGFQFPESGDLTVNLTQLSTGISRDLFARLGATNPSDPTSFAFVGNFAGNYSFSGNGLDDLWTTAMNAGASDIIPDNSPGSCGGGTRSCLYIPITNNAGTEQASGLSSAFNGQLISGTWRLTITEVVPGVDTSQNNPQFNGWTLTANVTDVPEPSYAPVFGALAALAASRFAAARRGPQNFRRQKADRNST